MCIRDSTYLGPIDGHDIDLLIEIFENSKNISGPLLIHTLTTKGKGYEYAKDKPRMFHGTPPFEVSDVYKRQIIDLMK